jgi:integrase
MMSDKKTFSPGPRRLSVHVSKDLTVKPYVSYYDDQGKRVRVYTGLSVPQTYEGRVAAAELLRQKIIREYVPVRSLEVRAWEWIESRKPHLRQKSYYGYCSKLRIFLRWKGERRMTPQLVSEYFQYRSEKVAGGTLHDDKIYLARVFDSITEDRFFDHIELPKFTAVTKQHYQRRHIKVIEQHLRLHDPALWFACQCVYYLFIRPGSELRLLKVHHFDLDEWRVHIPPNISKTHKSEYVMIPKAFRNDVEEFLEMRMPNEYVFPAVHEEGRPIGKNTFTTRYRKHMKHLCFGMQYSMYGWKNTGAIACVKAGVHPKILQLQLRHSSLEMTDRYLRKMGIMDMGDLADRFPGI